MARVVLARLERRAAELELGLERRIVAARRRVEALYLALTRRNDR